MIPKITHQIFFLGFDALTEADRQRIMAFRARNPGWDHRFYDRQAAEDWLAQNCSRDVQDAYHSIDPRYYAARADLLRYLICERHGGVYLDVKSEATLPLDDVLRDDDDYLLSQWTILRDRPAGQGNHRELDHVAGDEFVNWYIAASPGHRFLRAVIQHVVANIASYNVWRDGVGRKGVLRTTGPIAYTIAIHPLLSSFPHRFAALEDELGFEYSRFGDHKSHREHYGRHYQSFCAPVVKGRPIVGIAAALWFGRVKPQLERNRNRYKNAMQMMRGARS